MKLTNFKNYKKISKIKSSKIKRTEKIRDRKKYIRKRINKDSLKGKKKLENKLDKKHIDYQIKILKHKQKKNILEKKYQDKLLKRQTIATTSNIISDISRQINNNNEDDNIAVSGVGKVTNISSKILTRRVNKRGHKLVKNINKKSK
ncbi:hypothetical protein [Helcococcus bovis]|uniref:hypothetical protein n=1 Tax=Helcococcus bovis TaxID=3153252 RepID=UPI0038B799DC